jgi:hypothetical protein
MIEGSDDSPSYSYDPKVGNKNGRTIQGFSTDAMNRMRKCDSCDYYEDFQKFVDYYGDVYYADKWVSAAFDGKSTAFANGNGNFNDYSLEARTRKFEMIGTSVLSIITLVSPPLSCDFVYRDHLEGSGIHECGHVRYPRIGGLYR